jgi:hypothetical protein
MSGSLRPRSSSVRGCFPWLEALGMASKQSLANKAHNEAVAAIVAKGSLMPEEQVEWNDVYWPGLTSPAVSTTLR